MEQAKRDGILAEAGRAFGRFGFKKTSIDQIAKMAGVAKGTVYLACQSKQDLFYQVLHREVRKWIADVSTLIDPRVPADELLLRSSEAGVAYLEKRPLLKTLLFGEAHSLLPTWADRLDDLRALGSENVQQILRLGIKQGRFVEDLDVATTAELLLDLQLAYFVLHDRPGADHDARLARRKAAAFSLVLNGLRVRPDAAGA